MPKLMRWAFSALAIVLGGSAMALSTGVLPAIAAPAAPASYQATMSNRATATTFFHVESGAGLTLTTHGRGHLVTTNRDQASNTAQLLRFKIEGYGVCNTQDNKFGPYAPRNLDCKQNGDAVGEFVTRSGLCVWIISSFQGLLENCTSPLESGELFVRAGPYFNSVGGGDVTGFITYLDSTGAGDVVVLTVAPNGGPSKWRLRSS
jgi:hypothetical protein